MIPSSSRRVIVALSTIFLLGFLWYKRKRSSEQSDPGGIKVEVPEKTQNRVRIGDSAQKPLRVEVEPQPEVSVINIHTVASVGVAKVGFVVNRREPEVKPIDESSTLTGEKVLLNGKIERVTDGVVQENSDCEVCFENREVCLGSDTLGNGFELNVVASTSGVSVFEEGTEGRNTNCEVVEETCEQTGVTICEAITELKVESKEELFKEVPIAQKSNLNPNAADFILCGTEQREQTVNYTCVSKVDEEELITYGPSNSSQLQDGCSTHIDKHQTFFKFEELTHNTCCEVSLIEGKQDSGSKISWSSEIDSECGSEKTTGLYLKPESADNSVGCSSKPVEMARESSSDVDCDTPSIENNMTDRKIENGPSCLESKLSALTLEESTPKCEGRTEKSKVVKERHGVERDSANHSPADVMLESPSISNYSDVQSEGSSDSGKGGSDVATPPSRTPVSGSSVAGDLPPSSVYEFVLPQILVGRLIGRHGIVVHQIKSKTNANIFIKRHPETAKMKICAIEGTPMDIESALDMIRLKFPEKRFPNVTLEQVSFLPPAATFPLASEYFQLPLIEGVNNDVIVSSLVTPEHCFLQQPTHPTYLALTRLNMCMNLCYNEPNSPVLPLPVKEDVVCVAPTMGGWFRAQVVTTYPENETCDVRFLDYGGYLNVAQTDLRQIRQDFLTLPFQAAECYLANVKPINGVWVPEALAFFEQLTHGQVIQAQIHGYADNGIPVVYLFSIQGSEVIVVNQELVSRGYAELHEPAVEGGSEVLANVQQEVSC